MDNAATLQAMRIADLADVIADYPSEMSIGPVKLQVHINQLQLSPMFGERGFAEDGALNVIGGITQLREAGDLRAGNAVQLKRYGETHSRAYVVRDISMDSVLFQATIVPQSTERGGGPML